MEFNMTGTWVGQYTYVEGYPEPDIGTSFVFVIEMSDRDGILTGTFTDEETKDLFDIPGTVDGFIEGDFISFIKRYPCCWGKEEDGTLRKYEEMPSHELHYAGTFAESYWQGEWETTVIYISEDGSIEEYEGLGTWTMQKR